MEPAAESPLVGVLGLRRGCRITWSGFWDSVDVTTAASTPVLDIAPSPLGLRGIIGFAISDAGDAYAYSFGQELSRLFTLTDCT